MARNDTVLLDGIIDDRVEENNPSKNRGEVFEYLSFEQILKEYDLSLDDINYGWVDGKDDGGIDGFFIFVNGHLLQDLGDFSWPKTSSELTVWVITCKHHDTYRQATLDNLAASISELFDFRINSTDLNGSYSKLIIDMRNSLIFAYKKLSPRLLSFKINYAYVSRGDNDDVGESILSRSEQIKTITRDSFGGCDVSFEFFGSKELIGLYRQVPNFSLELPFIETLSRGERYVILVNLVDYYNFISDEGVLRRYLFDSNVRDFMGLNSVNEDIRITLNDATSPDFWLLNNGVTILATSASVIGKAIKMEDIQIVNGLQTTESIFRFFDGGGKDTQSRAVLVKVVVSKDEVIRDSVIRATNNQTAVEQSSLHATDKIQRDIEDILIRSGFYYERRKNFYRNQGVSNSDILSPLYLAAGYVCLILKSPFWASRLSARIMRQTEIYDSIFSEKISINVWPKIAHVFSVVDVFLNSVRVDSFSEGFLKKWRYLLSFTSVAIFLKTFNINDKNINLINSQSFNHNEVSIAWDSISNIIDITSIRKTKLSNDIIINVIRKISSQYEIHHVDSVEKTEIFKKYLNGRMFIKNREMLSISEDLIERVRELLPKQPWKPKAHEAVVSAIGCTNAKYFSVVKILIERGYFYQQIDGVLYDKDNNVVGFDEERVDSKTMKLKVV